MGNLADDWTIQPLETALRDADPAVRAQAALALGQVGNPDATPFLAAILSDSDAGVRASTARVLGWVGDTTAVPELITLLSDPDNRAQN